MVLGQPLWIPRLFFFQIFSLATHTLQGCCLRGSPGCQSTPRIWLIREPNALKSLGFFRKILGDIYRRDIRICSSLCNPCIGFFCETSNLVVLVLPIDLCFCIESDPKRKVKRLQNILIKEFIFF